MKNALMLGGFYLFAVLLTVIVSRVGAAPASIRSIEHTLSIVQRPDGNFDVTCLDGTLEIKSKEQVLANQVCAHLRTYGGRWRKTQGPANMCDMDMKVVRNANVIVKLSANFVSPCATMLGETQQCDALTCSLNLGGSFYNFDFSASGQATVTRLSDGGVAVYRGNAGSGSGGSGGAGTARLQEVSGVPNILQNTADNGVTWHSVCDDDFDQYDAAVACRELGFSGQSQKYDTGIYAQGDRDYGWDDLSCDGSEMSLGECGHMPWRDHNCEDGEHVQLTCDP